MNQRRSWQWLARATLLVMAVSEFTGSVLGCTAAPVLQRSQSPQSPPASNDLPSLVQSQKTDFDCETTGLLAKVLYQDPAKLYIGMRPSGAFAVNARWERGQAPHWYIEAQRAGEEAILGGLARNDPAAIQAGFRMFDWGFAHQAADGSFRGTGDPFHSTSFFVAAVARSLLLIHQSPQRERYAEQVKAYVPKLHRAAQWMISPKVWDRRMQHNQPYTHRFYLVAAALGLTSKITGDETLMEYARRSLTTGLAMQRSDGVNPERAGADSSYQMAGVVYAQRWILTFPKEPLTPQVTRMVAKALAWEQTKILPTGEISDLGNTRTARQERRRTGELKTVDHRLVFRGIAYWANATQDAQWAALARKIAQFYYPQNHGLRRPRNS